MTRVRKLAELEDFKARKVQEAILEDAKKCRGKSIPFVLMGHNCSFEIKDEDEEGDLVEKFSVGFETSFLDFSMSFPTQNGVNIIGGLFFAIEGFYGVMRDYFITENNEDEWNLSEDKTELISSLFVLKEFLIKEKKISFKEPNRVEREYYPNGAVHIEIEHFLNSEEAYAVSFDESGNTRSEYLLVGGKKTGVAKFYQESGALDKVVCYKNDEVVWERESNPSKKARTS